VTRVSAATALARSRLVHFLAIGGALWALAPAEKDAGTLRVEREEIERAVARAQANAGHALDDAERRGVIADLVRDRVLAAEGRRLGLADDDEVVRARMAMRMREALGSSAGGAGAPAPPEDEVRAEAVAQAARAPERIELEAAFVGKDHAGAGTLAEALAAARAAGAASPPGDVPPIPSRATWTAADLARAAGPGVARYAATAAGPAWSPPIASAWGFWVVRVLARRPASEAEAYGDAVRAVQRRRAGAAVDAAVRRAANAYRLEVATPEGMPRFTAADLVPPSAGADRAPKEVD
jgi:hypothetical protein